MTPAQLQTISVDELEALWKKHGTGLTKAQLAQTREPLSRLEVAPRVFQPRDFMLEDWKKREHVRNLAAVVKQGGNLDHLAIFAVAGLRIVVDGHCRLAAYRQAKRTTPVPVRYLRGSFAEALATAGRENARDKLPLTKEEKSEHAWRLVRFNEYRRVWSLREIESISGASKSLAGEMACVLRREDLAFDPRGLPWRDVLRRLRPDQERDPGWEEKLIHSLARKLRKACGRTPDKYPRIFEEALQLAYPRIVEDIEETAIETGEPSDF